MRKAEWASVVPQEQGSILTHSVRSTASCAVHVGRAYRKNAKRGVVLPFRIMYFLSIARVSYDYVLLHQISCCWS